MHREKNSSHLRFADLKVGESFIFLHDLSHFQHTKDDSFCIISLTKLNNTDYTSKNGVILYQRNKKKNILTTGKAIPNAFVYKA